MIADDDPCCKSMVVVLAYREFTSFWRLLSAFAPWSGTQLSPIIANYRRVIARFRAKSRTASTPVFA